MSMKNLKFKLKFLGKLITYLALVGTIAGIVNNDWTITIVGIAHIILGCYMHEFSE
jgi:hypothetical protein